MRKETEKLVPMIAEVDLLVVGGGLAGLPAAKAMALKGKKVMVIDRGTFLGYEIGQWQRPWVKWQEDSAGLIKEWFPEGTSGASPQNGYFQPVHMDRMKLKLEDVLMEAGVQILYASIPVQCKETEDGWLVIIANKSGRQAIKAQMILDCTQQSVVTRLTGKAGCTLVPTDKAYQLADIPGLFRGTMYM